MRKKYLVFVMAFCFVLFFSVFNQAKAVDNSSNSVTPTTITGGVLYSVTVSPGCNWSSNADSCTGSTSANTTPITTAISAANATVGNGQLYYSPYNIGYGAGGSPTMTTSGDIFGFVFGPTTTSASGITGSSAGLPNSGSISGSAVAYGSSVGGTGTYRVTICNAGYSASDSVCTVNSFNITSSAGAGGSISPLGTTSENYGSSQTYTITPNTGAGYSIANVSVDGSSVGAVSTYTFSNITTNHTISATFNLMAGTLTASPTSCSIAVGASSCNVTLTWTTTHPVSTSWITSSVDNSGNPYTNFDVSSPNINNGSQSVVIPYSSSGSRTFYLYNYNISLVPTSQFPNGSGITVASSCVLNTVWNGSICAQYALTVNKAGTGSGTVGGAGIYAYNTVAPATESPNGGSTFTGWSGDCSGTNPTYGVTMSAAKSCTATFTLIPTASFTNTPSCTIPAGSSGCSANITWTSSNTSTVNLTDGGDGFYAQTGTGAQSGTVHIPYNSGTYNIRNVVSGVEVPPPAGILATVTGTSACASGSTWIVSSGTCVAAPYGSFDNASPNPVYNNGVLSMNGWAADIQDGAPVSSVQIYIDGTSIGNATLGGSRPDVLAAYPSYPSWVNSGWNMNYTIPASLSTGSHTAKAVASDKEGLSSTFTYNFTVGTCTLPSVTTTASVSNVTQTSGTSGGSITSNGGCPVTVSGITWSTSSGNETYTVGNTATQTTDGWQSGGPWLDIAGGVNTYVASTPLTPGTTYYIKAYAENSVGPSFGNEIHFTTSAPTPVNGVCGTANGKAYPYPSSSYGSDTQCSSGTPSPNNAFPSAGNTAYWQCMEANGGTNSSTCSASQGAPSVTFSANPTTIVSGGSSTLTWSSSATSCTGTNFSTGTGSPNSGSVSVTPSSTTQYTVTCGGFPATQTVTVDKKPVYREH
ncbi:MAG: hypothetical protein P4L63_00555 [Candidatus Pacebacteria bacterium]|nr:hypothetical protein [Candidatus Paceibacterota bacterium]